MVDKGKVKVLLDAKFKGKSVSRELKEALATRWADKIETEDDIESYINEREEDVLDAAREADRRATTAAEKARKDAADAVNGKQPEKAPDQGNVPDGAPDWFKEYMLKNEAEKKALSEKLGAFEAQKTSETVRERFLKDDRIKDIPEALLFGRIPQNEADLETSITNVVNDPALKQIVSTLHTAGFGKDTPAGGAPTGGNGVKQATDAQVDAVIDKMKITV